MGARTGYEAGVFSWVDLVSHDLVTAGEFYAQLFGLTLQMADTAGGPPYGMFLLGQDVVAGIGQMSAEMKATGMPPVWNSYINVPDIHATAAAVVEHGGRIVAGPMPIMDRAGRGTSWIRPVPT